MILTDAGAPMVKLGEILDDNGYYKTLHVLCMAHAMHNVIGTIRKCYPEVNSVVMGVKELFSKSHARLSIFYKTAPGTQRPPAPVLTRFGTWLNATLYYANIQNRENLLRALKAIESKTPRRRRGRRDDQYERKRHIAFLIYIHREQLCRMSFQWTLQRMTMSDFKRFLFYTFIPCALFIYNLSLKLYSFHQIIRFLVIFSKF